jgi:hypothetical protein
VAPYLDHLESALNRIVPPRDPRLQTGALVFAGQRNSSA